MGHEKEDFPLAWATLVIQVNMQHRLFVFSLNLPLKFNQLVEFDNVFLHHKCHNE